MRKLYTLLLWLALPAVFAHLYWLGRRVPGYRERWAQRLGRFEPPTQQGGIWIHAVSVGEVRAISLMVKRLLVAHPDLPVTITTTTATGSAQVSRDFGGSVFHVYFPFDLPYAVDGFLSRVKPDFLVMVDTEIWPNLLNACARRGIPTLLANGRMSARSAARYARLGGFSRSTFGNISRIAAQDAADAARFVELGVPESRVTVTGAIKFDIDMPGSVGEQAELMRRVWQGRPVWIAASTHEGEEEIILSAHRILRERLPAALLVLVPRHPERFDRVFNLCRRQGMRVQRRSLAGSPRAGDEIYLGDTMGELQVMLGASDIAFFGGSLVPIGGHNMLEAAAQGVPVLFGPHVFNFTAISELFLEKDAGRMVKDADSLAELLEELLADASQRARLGENARRVVEDNSGALKRLETVLGEMLQGRA